MSEPWHEWYDHPKAFGYFRAWADPPWSWEERWSWTDTRQVCNDSGDIWYHLQASMGWIK